MDIRNIIYIIFLTILLGILTLFRTTSTFELVYFQFVFAIMIYINYKSGLSLIGILLALLISDACLEINLAFSILAFSISGFVISLFSKTLPLLKHQPFIQARLIWLIASVIIYTLMLSSFDDIALLIKNISLASVLNCLFLFLITYFIEPLLSRKGPKDIIVG